MYKPVSISVNNIMSYESVEYKFRNGEAIIVVGDNKDDPGQRGNGAGKSGINEAIAIAITGSTIRDVKSKEIVREGEEFGRVELTLKNTLHKSEVRIARIVYSGTKSGEVKLYVNGKEIVYSDVNEYNKEIFKLLGISKEDFYDFYLITKEYYKPFLKVGDTIKKAIINRFSGADKIDAAIPKVLDEVTEYTSKIKDIDRQIAGSIGKQQVIGDQIKKEEDKYSEEGKQKQINDIDEEIYGVLDDMNYFQECVATENQTLDKLRQDILAVDASNNSAAIKECEEVIAELKQELTEIETRNERLTEARSGRALESQTLRNKLAGLIECPKCSHEFTLADKDLNIKQAQVAFTKLNVEIDRLDVKRADARASMEEYTAALKEARKTLNSLRAEDEENAKVAVKHRKNIRTSEENIEIITKKYNASDIKLKDLEAQKKLVLKGKSTRLEELNEEMLRYLDEQTEWEKKLQAEMSNKAEIEKWLINFKNFKSYLANKSIKNIEDYTNMYLQSMGTNLSIKLDGYRMLANKKMKEEITCSVQRNGFDVGSYGKFSGGERGRIDVAVVLAIQTLINLNSCKNGLDLLILDEVMDSIDSLGLESIVQGLQGVTRTVMIVSQVEINALSSQTVTVTKRDGKSTITG